VTDQSPLVDVASAVAEGAAVDWNVTEQSAKDAAELAVVRELRVLECMTKALRTPEGTPSTATPGANSRLRIGETWGHLRIAEEIGQGSFGSVYRAWDARLECEVALKLIRSSGVSRSFDLSRSIREARLLARVRHRNVVRVFGSESHDDRFGLWMEFIPGRTLEQVLALHGPMSAAEAVPVGIDLCHALAAVHRAGLLHRDVKAHNVMREGGGRIVLMDFGTGRDTASDEVFDSLAGTPLYLAPELFQEHGPSVASDVYSLGVLLYHLLTGDYPVKGRSREDVKIAHQQAQRHALRDIRPDLAPSYIDVIDCALAPNPADRYGSAGEFGNALAGVAGIRYAPDGPPRPRKWQWAAGAFAGLALAFIAVSQYDQLNRARSESNATGLIMEASSAGSLGAGATVATPYNVTASFYAVRDGQEIKLAHGSRVVPGDKLFVTIEASQPVFVYVINHDEAGQSYLLFPLAGYVPANPVPLSRVNRLPGSRNGKEHYWEVTSAGGREHFYLYANPQRLNAFEQLLAALPRAELGRSVSSVPLPPSIIGNLRGVGGITPGQASSAGFNNADLVDLSPLSDAKENAMGIWARQVTFENPSN
jgi:eukaryotic-like serine/threonine-protein kinase